MIIILYSGFEEKVGCFNSKNSKSFKLAGLIAFNKHQNLLSAPV